MRGFEAAFQPCILPPEIVILPLRLTEARFRGAQSIMRGRFCFPQVGWVARCLALRCQQILPG
ncbi:hypothetical protein EBE87_24225 [Pseudoroseomonas wenyumeiae]|uniref:Uncharacterized protein n=1 Tax=Teichococcus wenyumeiae TaxID=2478470 RepID=A0A3A9JC81_9PROT|nr:hypothetical protein D6Z83_12885 [Pseudoroseomonas wenyumeiae]RMI17044.1 hypothetical protein EBE87_24225 [Pseudoroseomonas wenyumeiae]